MSKTKKNVAVVASTSESKKNVKAPAPVVAQAPVESEVVAKTTKEKRAEHHTKAVNTGALITKGAGADVLGGAIGRRTHAIHVVLLDAARAGALLTTKEITAQATSVLGVTCNATASHLNTMKERLYLTRENGAWRLTDLALKLCGATWAQDLTPAPTKKPSKKK